MPENPWDFQAKGLPPVGGKLYETCGGAKKSRLLLGGGSFY